MRRLSHECFGVMAPQHSHECTKLSSFCGRTLDRTLFDEIHASGKLYVRRKFYCKCQKFIWFDFAFNFNVKIRSLTYPWKNMILTLSV